MNPPIPCLALTPGEPAGIGPDLTVMAAQRHWPAQIVAVADTMLLRERAAILDLPLVVEPWTPGSARRPSEAGHLFVCEQALERPARPGHPDPANTAAMLGALDRACDGCLNGDFDALVTGPVDKRVVNEAGIAFIGHTEYLAARTGTKRPLMLLVAGELRVALVTTHLPLRQVPGAVTKQGVGTAIETLHDGLRTRFGIGQPRILVLGLNPHAGEGGYLGHEETETIEPVLSELQERGLALTGPVPADTAFTPHRLEQADAVLAMYHDQGLPVLKHRGFGRAVNVTLGLPILRTSVDHGTATDLAGSGQADPGSLYTALKLAISMAARTGR